MLAHFGSIKHHLSHFRSCSGVISLYNWQSRLRNERSHGKIVEKTKDFRRPSWNGQIGMRALMAFSVSFLLLLISSIPTKAGLISQSYCHPVLPEVLKTTARAQRDHGNCESDTMQVPYLYDSKPFLVATVSKNNRRSQKQIYVQMYGYRLRMF